MLLLLMKPDKRQKEREKKQNKLWEGNNGVDLNGDTNKEMGTEVGSGYKEDLMRLFVPQTSDGHHPDYKRDLLKGPASHFISIKNGPHGGKQAALQAFMIDDITLIVIADSTSAVRLLCNP